MALHSIYSREGSDLTPEQAARLESIYLSRRAKDARRYRERPVTEAENYMRVARNSERVRNLEEPSPAPEPAPEVRTPLHTSKPRRRHRKPPVALERRLSLEEMSRQLTGKGKRR